MVWRLWVLTVLTYCVLGFHFFPAQAQGQPGAPANISPRPVVTLPLVGVSDAEALAIFTRNRDELEQLPGVEEVWLSTKEIYVVTTDPEVLPEAMDGLPIKAISPVLPGAVEVGAPPLDATSIQ